MNSRQLVKSTLEFKNNTGKVPVHKWLLPWAKYQYPEMVQKLNKDFPDDIVDCPKYYKKQPVVIGDPCEIGTYIDEWGCKFNNIHRGIIGEVKEPIIKDEDWNDSLNFRFPTELLTVDTERVNEFCNNTDKFVLSGLSPRVFERLQFLRGTEDLFVDLILKPKDMMKFIGKIHDFYCEMLTNWAKTDVDAIKFMDDWGSQLDLLISHDMWKEIFKPMYKDYINIAKKYNKKIFMHSDGNILRILPDLIELGLDAINSQVFCMGVDKLEQFAGDITFWGEIDRQHLLPKGTLNDIDQAVNSVKNTLWKNGGCISQCEFGPGAKKENVYQVFKSWKTIENFK